MLPISRAASGKPHHVGSIEACLVSGVRARVCGEGSQHPSEVVHSLGREFKFCEISGHRLLDGLGSGRSDLDSRNTLREGLHCV